MSLHLEILNGPKHGEKFEYPPGSTVRIGRIIRGNNLTLKHSTISSKHLLIQSQPQSIWTVQDLHSSNGTTLNSTTHLAPFQPFDLRNGDVISLGDSCSMLVNIVFETCSNVRRFTRSQVGALEKVLENETKKRKNLPELPLENYDVGQSVDLETMTLADLFDYWEVSLPREVKEASVRFIEEIREKAKRVEEFMMKQKRMSC